MKDGDDVILRSRGLELPDDIPDVVQQSPAWDGHGSKGNIAGVIQVPGVGQGASDEPQAALKNPCLDQLAAHVLVRAAPRCVEVHHKLDDAPVLVEAWVFGDAGGTAESLPACSRPYQGLSGLVGAPCVGSPFVPNSPRLE